MKTDYRALCAELADMLEANVQLPAELETESLTLLDRARAALAEPVGEGPTDEELKAAYWKAYRQNTIRDSEECFLAALRAIYRWDRPALAEPVGEGPTEEELLQVAAEAGGLASIPLDSPFGDEFMPDELIAFARAVLARWGHQPAPPAAGEAGELAAWLRGANWDGKRQSLATRAADLLSQRHPAPVAVSEKPLAQEAYIAFVQICKGNSDDAGTYKKDEELVISALKRLDELEVFSQRHSAPAPAAEGEVGEVQP